MAHPRLLAVAVAGALALGACSHGSGAPEPEAASPSTTVRPFREAEFPDTRGVDLTEVQGGAGDPAPIPIWGGDATLNGVLTGPEGPVVGGRVRLERFVGRVSSSVEITTNQEGRWRARGIHGGRYRVRGWRIPDLAMNQSIVLFLGASEERTVDLRPTEQGGVDVQALLLDAAPMIGQPVTLTALVTRHVVDINGVVQARPLAGVGVTLASSAGWEGLGERAVDGEGRVEWVLTCTTEAPAPLRLRAGDGSLTVPAPACRPQPSPVPPPEDRIDPPVADFAVGSSFTPPFAGPLPAGTYEVTETTGACALVYERWAGGRWATQRTTNTSTTGFTLDTFARNLETLGATPPCTYRRTA